MDDKATQASNVDQTRTFESNESFRETDNDASETDAILIQLDSYVSNLETMLNLEAAPSAPMSGTSKEAALLDTLRHQTKRLAAITHEIESYFYATT